MAANNSYEQSVALIAAANRVVQDPNSVGAALRTISLRLRGTSATELEEAGEDTTGAIESKSKLRSKVKGLSGVDILTDTGAYKSTYDILLEISKVWKDMSDINQAALLEIIAGKTRSNTAAAILSNTIDLEEAYVQALEAEGSALQENEKYLDSIQGRIDLFTNAVQTMWNNAIDSDFVKWIVNIGTGLIKVVDQLGLVRTLLFGILTYTSVFKKNGGLDFAELLGIQDKQGKSLIGKAGLTGWIVKKYQAKKSKNTPTVELIDDISSTLFGEQASIFDDDYQMQADINEKLQALKRAKAELQQLRATKFNDIQIPDEAIEYKQNNRRKTYLREVLIPNKEQEIAAIEKDIEDITTAGRIKIEQARIKLAEGDDGQISFDIDEMFVDTVQTTTQQYQSMMDAMSKFTNMKLEMPNMHELELANVMDTINAKTSEGQGALLQYFSTLGDGDEALQAYIASLNGGQASLTGFNNFIAAHNAGLKASSVAAKLAAVGHAALNAALSMGLSILIQFVMEGLNKLIQYLQDVMTPTKKLAEELSDLRSELSTIESELDSLNSELQTTQDRMAELLALPALSFTEKEELENLKKQNAELERKITLQESLKESQESKIAETSKENIDTVWNSTKADKAYYIDENGVIHKDEWNKTGVDTKTALNRAMIAYKSEEIYAQAKKELEENGKLSDDTFEKIVIGQDNIYNTKEEVEAYRNLPSWLRMSEENLVNDFKANVVEKSKDNKTDIAKGINLVLGDENFTNLKYGDDKEINAFLDELYAYSLKWQQAQGEYVKSDAISALFDSSSTKEMQILGKTLREIADGEGSDAEKNKAILQELSKIDSTTDAYNRLNLAMATVGVTAQDIADYFVLETGAFDSDTIEGITAQYAKGTQVLKQFKDALSQSKDGSISYTGKDVNGNKITKTIKWDELFDKDDEGKFTANKIKIAEVLQGVSEEVRIGFANIAEDVKNGNISFKQAIDSFSASGVVAACKLIESEISELNTSVFKDLGDELTGVIDTFSEFGSALESVASSMETVSTAQTQMANSGRISVKTALELMQSTDNWNELLEIENGNIRLVDNATEILVQSKLDLIKKNLQAALSTVEAQLAEISATEASADMAYTIEESTNLAVQQLAGNMAYLTKLMEAYALQAAGENVDINDYIGQAEQAKATVLAQTDYKKNTAVKIGTEALEKKKEELEAMLEMYEGIDTPDVFNDYYDYDNTPGDKDLDGSEGRKSDAFQEAMDYWENRIGAEQAKYEQVQNEIDLLEKQGKKAGANYYRMQGLIEEERLSLLEQQKDEAQEMLKTFDEGSEEWWEVANTLNDIEGNIDDVTASLQDLNDAMHNLKWDSLEELHNRFSDIISDISDIRDVLSSEDMFDDEGQWTEAGVATLGTHIDDYRWNQDAANEILKGRGKFGDDDYIPALQEFLDKEYVGNESHWKAIGIDSEQEYNDKKKELTDYYNEYIKASKSAEQSVVDMYENQIDAVEKYISTLVDGYNDYIEVTKEALDAERDLYEFKKSTSEKTKNIADLERRIASLSGSDNAADVAERRRLQAELTDAKSDLDDHYYSHAKDQQQQALDEEALAYEESMNNYIEGLRTTLDTATLDMTMFMKQVIVAVSTNAETVEQKYHDTGLAINKDLTDPWTAAKNAMKDYEGEQGLGLMNKWLADGQFFDKFKTDTTSDLTSPWNAGKTAADAFDKKVGTVMNSVLQKIQSNVSTAQTELQKVYNEISKINTTPLKVNTEEPAKEPEKELEDTPVVKPTTAQAKVYNCNATLDASANLGKSAALIGATASASSQGLAEQKAKGKIKDQVTALAKKQGMTQAEINRHWNYTWLGRIKYKYYAKGTTGTDKDQWAVTDEIGDELVLIPGKDGNLQYMRKGTGVVPADLTTNLMEWGKINPNMANMSSIGTNLNMVSNAINKPELNLSFEALVKAERIDKDTLPEVKKFVQQEVNSLVKQMNYALKGVGSR